MSIALINKRSFLNVIRKVDVSCSLWRSTQPNRFTRYFSSKPDFSKEGESKYFEYNKLEGPIYNWWENQDYFKPKKQLEKPTKSFVVPMPPPNVTGYLHMGHAIFLALQDIMTRFHRMKGEDTLWLPGTDHAGIATQLLVERALQKEGLSRQSIGRDEFLNHVWKWKREKGDYIIKQMKRMGASADWSRSKFTLDSDMSEAVVESFVRLHDKGLIYRGSYMVNWSPNLQTAVSDLEVDYVEEEGTLYYFKYPLADDPDNSYIPVATTRPETILGDSAVCVHPDDSRFSQYIGKMVRVPMTDRLIPVIADTYVAMEFGTGALKVTPAHDVNDYKLGQKHNLPMINIMNKDASINHYGGIKYQGLDRFECRKKIWQDMKDQGLVIKDEKHTQRVPRSQRGGEVIEPLISQQWFLKMDSMAKRAVDSVKQKELKIIPERFEREWFNWLENIHDWCISRQLWWGHRIPVYYINPTANRSKSLPVIAEGTYVVARNLNEAQTIALTKYGQDIELTQDEDVLDTWFSSGLWPFSTVGWPNEQSSDFKRFYPASVLETGYDILFFWVARMVTLGLELTDKLPFHTIYMHGLVRDKDGQKMSKTKGNVIDPIETIDKYGADALRFTLVTKNTPGQDVPLMVERIEHNRNFVNKLWNIGKYLQHSKKQLLEAHPSLAKDFDSIVTPVNSLLSLEEISKFPIPEQYFIIKLHSLIGQITQHLESHEYNEAGTLIYDYLWNEYADWFVEISKTHLRHSDPKVALQSYKTLSYLWDVSLRMLHPFMPYVTEILWQQVPHSEESLMIASWPTFSVEPSSLINQKSLPDSIQNDIDLYQRFQNIIKHIRNARSDYKIEPNIKLQAIIISKSSSILSLVEQEKASLMLLTKIDEKLLTTLSYPDSGSIQADIQKQYGPCLQLIVDEMTEIYLPQSKFIDKSKEKQRLTKQRDTLIKEIASFDQKLSNNSFIQRAPKELIEETQKKKQASEELLANVLKALKELE